MSSEGGAVVVAVPVGAVAVVVAAPIILAAGGVILAAQGAMWCGKQVHAHYEARLRTWETGRQAAIQEATAQQSSASALLAGEQARYQRMLANRPPDPSDANQRVARALAAEVQRALADAEAQARLSPNKTTITPEEVAAQRMLARERGGLAAEIDIARAMGVESGVIARAEAARGQSLADVQAARAALNAAWTGIHNTEVQRESQRQRATADLIQTEIALEQVDAFTRAAPGTLTPHQMSELAEIKHAVAVAHDRLRDAPDRALEDAPSLLARARTLEDTTLAIEARKRREALMATARSHGRITALRTLVADARELSYAPAETLNTWDERLSGAEKALSGAAALDLRNVETTIADVEQQVFTAIARGQQRNVIGQIAAVMSQSGFRDYQSSGETPTIETLADGAIRVTGVRNDARPGMGHDDKVVTFTVSPKGDLEYDFSGYVGDACHNDMQTIFEGLKAKGVVIVDKNWQESHQGSMTYGEAVSSAPGPLPVTNKRQARITAKVIEALKRMGFTTDEIRTSSIGGDRRVSASKGGQPYYDLEVGSTGDIEVGGVPAGQLPAPLRQALELSTGNSNGDDDGGGYISGPDSVKA